MTNDPGEQAPPLRATAAPLKLHSLGGGVAPPELPNDLRRLLRMPREALAKFWQALGPCLVDKLTEETERLLDAFRDAYRVSDDDLARAIKGSRLLIRAAAKHDLPARALAEDLDLLCPEAPLIKELLVTGYEPYRTQRRLAMIKAAIADHGKLLVGAQWRLDTIEASEQGAGIRMPVTVLTLRYREGAKEKRITLQALPDMIEQLKGICGQIIPGNTGT